MPKFQARLRAKSGGAKLRLRMNRQGNGKESGVRAKAQLLLIAYLGFISLGLPDTLIGVAWPSIRERFALRQGDVSLIFFGVGVSYFVSSIFTGKILTRVSIGALLAGSSGLVALSGLGYGLAPAWALFACFSVLHGLGSGAIDTGLNHYVAHHFSARHMNWLHSFYSVGAMFGPMIMTAAVARNSFRTGYLTVACILVVLAFLFLLTRRKWDAPDDDGADVEKEKVIPATFRETLSLPIVWVQIAIFFVYTGLEVAVGQWSFTILTESRGFSEKLAGSFVTAYWGSILAGRILFGFVADRFGLDRLLRWSMVTAVAGTTLFAWNGPRAAMAVALVLAGLGLAAIFPCMMTRTAQRLGKAMAAQAIGFQVSAAMLGAAALPSLCGWLSQSGGLERIAIAVVAMSMVLMALHESLLAASAAGQARSARISG